MNTKTMKDGIKINGDIYHNGKLVDHKRIQKCVDVICDRLTKETVIGSPTMCVEELECIGNIISDEITNSLSTIDNTHET